MQGDTFTAGVAPGAPATYSEVKILIMHVLACLETPVDFQLIHEALREYDLVNYFTLVEALENLTDAGYLNVTAKNDDGQEYTSTESGRALAAELASTLPMTLRDKADASMDRALKRQRRRSEVRIKEERRGSGFLMELAIPDGDTDLLSVKLFAPTGQDRDRIRRHFLNDPVYVYQGILALLTGNAGVLGDVAPEEEKLF